MARNQTRVTAHKKNFETLRAAFLNGDVALMECEDNQLNEKAAVICAVTRDEKGDYVFTPFARFFNGNPYDILTPPMEAR